MNEEESQLVGSNKDADSPAKQMMRQAKEAAIEAEEKMKGQPSERHW